MGLQIFVAPGLSVHERSRTPTNMAVSRLTNSGIILQQCVPHSRRARAALSEEAIAHHLGFLSPPFLHLFREVPAVHIHPNEKRESCLSKIRYCVKFIERRLKQGPQKSHFVVVDSSS